MKTYPDVPRGKQLTPWAEDELANWVRLYRHRGCTCFIVSPPCSCCEHPGNPYNLEATDDAWEQEIHG